MEKRLLAFIRPSLLGLIIVLSVLIVGCRRQVSVPAQGVGTTARATSIPSESPEPTTIPAGTATSMTTVIGTSTYTVTISSTRSPLTVEEYLIASTTADTWGDAWPDLFRAYEEHRRLGCPPEDLETVFDRRRPWRLQAAREGITETNRVLAPYGYRLVEQDEWPSCIPQSVPLSHALYQGEELLASDLYLSPIAPISVNEAGDDFALLMPEGTAGSIFLRSDSLERWMYSEQSEHAYTSPVFVGEDLITVKRDPLKGAREFTVWRGDEVVYTYTSPLQLAEYPVNTLRSWQGRWVLEVDEQVLVDGQSLNEQLGYDAIFQWRLLQGLPFYLFREDGQVGISYDGEVLPRRYDAVLHNLCCGYALFNPGGNERMVWFHAWRDGTWYFVEVGYYGD